MSPEELADLKWLASEVNVHGANNVIVYSHGRNGVPNGLFALHLIPKLLEHIDSQARQIEALKEIAIQERIRDNYSCIKIDKYDPIEYYKQRLTQQEARRQLAAEHPDLFRGLTKMMADSEKEALP